MVALVLAQLRMVASVAEHERLHAELEVDDAAGDVLDVPRAFRTSVLGAHLLAHGDDVGVELRRIARRREDLVAQFFEALAHAAVAGREARARERLVLPCPRALELVVAERLERAHEQPRGAVGPQPQVHLVEHARGRVAAEPGVHALRDAREALGCLRAGVQEDDVEVGAIAELLPAQLSVSDDA